MLSPETHQKGKELMCLRARGWNRRLWSEQTSKCSRLVPKVYNIRMHTQLFLKWKFTVQPWKLGSRKDAVWRRPV